MEIYNLNSEILNEALQKKNKKVINDFLKLPNVIKKKIILDIKNIHSLLEIIKIEDYYLIFSLFQDDFNMFQKLYINLMISLKNKYTYKYRFNKLGRYRYCIDSICNIFISHLMVLADNDKIEVFRKFIENYKKSFEYKELGKKKQNSRSRKVNVLKQIINIYNIEFQNFIIYLLNLKKEEFINIIIDSNMVHINYKFLYIIVNDYTNIFINMYKRNNIIKTFVDKNIKKFIYILEEKKIGSLIPKNIYLPNILLSLNLELIKENISKGVYIDFIYLQNNIAKENRSKFFDIVFEITNKINDKYFIDYLENDKLNLTEKDFKILIDFSDKITTNINYNIIFQNLLNKGKIRLLNHLLKYNIKKIPFEFLHKKIIIYKDLVWREKYNMKYTINFLLEKNILDKPNEEQSKTILNFFTSNKLKDHSQYNFSPYWEIHVFKKLWVFFMKTSFINIILDTLIQKIDDTNSLNSECPICYCDITKGDCKIDCGHCFHKDCLIEYYKNKNYTNSDYDNEETIILDCPYCRHTILEF